MSDDFMDEMPVPAAPGDSGIGRLEHIQALEARILALETLVDMLVERDASAREESAEEYVNAEGGAIFGRMMHSEGFTSATLTGIEEVAETVAVNVIERHGREKQVREAN